MSGGTYLEKATATKALFGTENPVRLKKLIPLFKFVQKKQTNFRKTLDNEHMLWYIIYTNKNSLFGVIV